MNLKNYELSDYEEYLLKRTGTENVSFTDGMVYATYHPQKNTTEIMKTNDDEFVALCIEAEEQVKPLQINSTDDNSEWLDCIRFPVDSTEVNEFERVFYERHPDVLGTMTPAVRYYFYRKIKKMPPFVEFNEEQRLLMGDKKTSADYDPLALADFAREHNINAYTIMYFHNYNHKPVIRYRCESLHEFLELEFNKMIEYGVKLKRCERCGQFFTVKGNYDARYCNRIHPGEVRSCRDLAAEENYKNKMTEDKAILIYRKYYRRYSARVKVNQIKKPEFKKWKYAALT